MNIAIKRVYETPEKSDGMRVLVDRLWPRGLAKEDAKVDLWLKEIAPSNELRKWFGHDPEKWKEFKKRYINEIKKNQKNIDLLNDQLKKEKVTLVYAAKDEAYNNAVVLKEFFEMKS